MPRVTIDVMLNLAAAVSDIALLGATDVPGLPAPGIPGLPTLRTFGLAAGATALLIGAIFGAALTLPGRRGRGALKGAALGLSVPLVLGTTGWVASRYSLKS